MVSWKIRDLVIFTSMIFTAINLHLVRQFSHPATCDDTEGTSINHYINMYIYILIIMFLTILNHYEPLLKHYINTVKHYQSSIIINHHLFNHS